MDEELDALLKSESSSHAREEDTWQWHNDRQRLNLTDSRI